MRIKIFISFGLALAALFLVLAGVRQPSRAAPALPARQATTGADWITETLDSAGVVGQYPSPAIDSNGLARIRYYDSTNGALKYAWQGRLYGIVLWAIETADDSAGAGMYTSLALDPND